MTGGREIKIATEENWALPNEEPFRMTRHELHGLRRQVLGLKDDLRRSVSDSATWAAFFYGVAVTAGIALSAIGYTRANPGVFILVLLWASTATGLAVGTWCVLFLNDSRTRRERAIDRVCNQFDEIEERVWPGSTKSGKTSVVTAGRFRRKKHKPSEA